MLPVNYSEVGATGVTATNPISVPGIVTGNVLLAVISWSAGADPAGLDLTDFTVGDGAITAGTIDTSSKLLWVVWAEARA